MVYYASYIGAFIGNRHGAGTGKIWLDDVTCTGGEYGLEKCQHSVWDSHNCNHGEDVSISCGSVTIQTIIVARITTYRPNAINFRQLSVYTVTTCRPTCSLHMFDFV